MCDAPKANDMKIEILKSHIVLDAKGFAHFSTLMKCHRSNCHRVTTENGELQKEINAIQDNPFDA